MGPSAQLHDSAARVPSATCAGTLNSSSFRLVTPYSAQREIKLVLSYWSTQRRQLQIFRWTSSNKTARVTGIEARKDDAEAVF